MHDELDHLLSPDRGTVKSREELFLQSARILKRRATVAKVTRRAVQVSVCMAFAAMGWYFKPPVYVDRAHPVMPLANNNDKPVEVAVQPPAPEKKAEPNRPSLRELEQQAELSDNRQEVAKFYREAGDRYLNDEQDYSQAARCYRLHLEAASDDERRTVGSESWMLLSMKSSLTAARQ